MRYWHIEQPCEDDIQVGMVVEGFGRVEMLDRNTKTVRFESWRDREMPFDEVLSRFPNGIYYAGDEKPRHKTRSRIEALEMVQE